MKCKYLPLAFGLLLAAVTCIPSLAQQVAAKEEGWILLFDGKSFDGWTVSKENPNTFKLEDGAFVANGPRAHLYYTGPVNGATFKNFELKVDVMTRKSSNGGIYFHTRYLESGWPDKGFEVQVNNSYDRDPRRTGSLYMMQDVNQVPVPDDEWFTEHIIVKDKRVMVRVNDKTVVDWTEPVPPQPPRNAPGRVLGEGTFALQGHDPGSTVYYKNIRVKPE
ncbi:MAG: DUF1080 domain-containing protein [Acidobacteriota bacterium]